MDISRLFITTKSTGCEMSAAPSEKSSPSLITQISIPHLLRARETGSYNQPAFTQLQYKIRLQPFAERDAPYSQESKLDAIANCVTLIARSERDSFRINLLLAAADSLGCSKKRIIEKVKRFLKRTIDDANNSIITDLPEKVEGFLNLCTAIGLDKEIMNYSDTLYSIMLRAMIYNELELFEFLIQWAKPLQLEKTLLGLPHFRTSINPRNPLAELLNHCNFSGQPPKLAIPLILEYQKHGLTDLLLNNIKSLHQPHTFLEWACKNGYLEIIDTAFNCFDFENRNDLEKAAKLLRGNTADSLTSEIIQEQLMKWKRRIEEPTAKLQIPHLQKLHLQ